MFVNKNQKKFIVTPKIERSVTLTVRLETELNNYIEEIARKSGRSRNELINKALRFAFDNLEFYSGEPKNEA
ncbi:MAG: ribbon-helix-helix protein, CopG family [Clostridia bacterium]|nr:ribbon-helix-helix protein, CopG family [Clostridia bacterium]